MKYSGDNKEKGLFFKLEIGGSPELLRLVRACLSEFGMEQGMNSREIYDVNLSVNEICTNIMEHDYHWDPNQKIVISVESQPDALEIRIRDYAPPKNPSSFHSRDLGEVTGNGLGIFLVGEVMDEIDYNQHMKNGNEIIMRKYCQKNPENAHEI